MQKIVFYCKIYCSLNIFRAPLCPSSGAQDLYRWLLPVVLGALVYRSLVWCGAVGYVSAERNCGLCVRRTELWVICGLCVRRTELWIMCGLCVRKTELWVMCGLCVRRTELWVMCPQNGAVGYVSTERKCGLCVGYVSAERSCGLCVGYVSVKRSCGLYVGYVSAKRTHNPHLHTRPTTCKPKRQVTQAGTICINLELLMIGILAP